MIFFFFYFCWQSLSVLSCTSFSSMIKGPEVYSSVQISGIPQRVQLFFFCIQTILKKIAPLPYPQADLKRNEAATWGYWNRGCGETGLSSMRRIQRKTTSFKIPSKYWTIYHGPNTGPCSKEHGNQSNSEGVEVKHPYPPNHQPFRWWLHSGKERWGGGNKLKANI